MAIIDPAVKAEEMYIGNGTTIAWKLIQEELGITYLPTHSK